MGYKKGLVYFIDVLGTKDRNFNDNLKIASVFRNEMNNIQLRHRNTSVVDRCVFFFSDCVAFAGVAPTYHSSGFLLYSSVPFSFLI